MKITTKLCCLLFWSLPLFLFGQFQERELYTACESCGFSYVQSVDMDRDGDLDVVAASLNEGLIN